MVFTLNVTDADGWAALRTGFHSSQRTPSVTPSCAFVNSSDEPFLNPCFTTPGRLAASASCTSSRVSARSQNANVWIAPRKHLAMLPLGTDP